MENKDKDKTIQVYHKEFIKHYHSLYEEGDYVKDEDFIFIIKEFNLYLANLLIEEGIVYFPMRLGKLVLIELTYKPRFKNGKLIGLPLIDLNNSTKGNIVRHDIDKTYKVLYSRKGALLPKGHNVNFRTDRGLRERLRILKREFKITTYYG